MVVDVLDDVVGVTRRVGRNVAVDLEHPAAGSHIRADHGEVVLEVPQVIVVGRDLEHLVPGHGRVRDDRSEHRRVGIPRIPAAADDGVCTDDRRIGRRHLAGAVGVEVIGPENRTDLSDGSAWEKGEGQERGDTHEVVCHDRIISSGDLLNGADKTKYPVLSQAGIGLEVMLSSKPEAVQRGC